MWHQLVVVLWDGQVYIPTEAHLGEGNLGGWVTVEPVRVVGPDIEEITKALEAVGETEHPRVSTSDWMKTRGQDVLLRATGARNWKTLARRGASYAISRQPSGIRVAFSKTDAKGRWTDDTEKQRRFPVDTPLRDIVVAILEDARSRQGLG